MHSLIDLPNKKANTAEQKLEEIRFPIENLQLTLSALTKMYAEPTITSEELNALMISIHHQVVQIAKTIQP